MLYTLNFIDVDSSGQEIDGGSVIPKQILDEFAKATRPQDPIRTGYVFDDYYTDKECNDAYDWDQPVAGDLTLYVRFEEEE